MSKRMLRSVLAAALSAVALFGAVSGLAGKSSDARADTASVEMVAGEAHVNDTSWD
ncbi:hypothetical protein ACIHFC_18010 [Streptomyces sp. NPDC052013]|uniref:hypothetical protein n=1 Tax=Streptomyces sp. NPDC052013 TaxID=3365679 RepID=UPI0037D5B34A